jgi:uncharacterized OsmC-like protein
MNPAGIAMIDTWLAMPGVSHFIFRSDAGETGEAPSGLALLSAGIAFCYMTQLSRYIEHMKLNIHEVRLVQLTPFEVVTSDGDTRSVAYPIDTHLFLNGDAPEETHGKLLRIAARTCYLHATAAAALEPIVRICCNGEPLD